MLVSSNDFAVNIVMKINITINKTFPIHDLVEKLFMPMFKPNEYQYFRCFNIRKKMCRLVQPLR